MYEATSEDRGKGSNHMWLYIVWFHLCEMLTICGKQKSWENVYYLHEHIQVKNPDTCHGKRKALPHQTQRTNKACPWSEWSLWIVEILLKTPELQTKGPEVSELELTWMCPPPPVRASFHVMRRNNVGFQRSEATKRNLGVWTLSTH